MRNADNMRPNNYCFVSSSETQGYLLRTVRCSVETFKSKDIIVNACGSGSFKKGFSTLFRLFSGSEKDDH